MSDEILKREIALTLGDNWETCCDEEIAEKLLPLFDRVIVASFEQAVWAIEEAHRRNTSWENAMSRFRNFILAQIPAKVRLRAEIRELERVEAEAKWWHAQRGHHGQNWCCDRVAAISQELAEKRERLEREK